MSSLDRPAVKPFLMSLASSALNTRASPVVITHVAAVSRGHENVAFLDFLHGHSPQLV